MRFEGEMEPGIPSDRNEVNWLAAVMDSLGNGRSRCEKPVGRGLFFWDPGSTAS